MKKLLTLSVIMVAVAALCVPAAAQFPPYDHTWSTGFEQPTYGLGPLVGQDGWLLPAGQAVSPNVVAAPVHTGSQAAEQGVGLSSANKDLTYLAGGNVYKWGRAQFWVYDPGDVGDPPVQTDGRVGVHSSMGADSISKMWTAQIQTNNPTLNWEGQWSWSPVMMDGVAHVEGPGFTFDSPLAAPRVMNAWSYVWISWVFQYAGGENSPDSGGTAHVEWRVNQTSATPNLYLDFDSTSGRWANAHEVAGVVIGSEYNCATPTGFDDILFEADAVPEPSSLLALGTGLIGLVGVIRRRR